MSELVVAKRRGLYCVAGDFYIDPWQPVERAVITHAHADHAYFGNKHYLAHHFSKEVLLYRLGDIQLQTVAYGEKVLKNGVEISLHPAGHVIGLRQQQIDATAGQQPGCGWLCLRLPLL